MPKLMRHLVFACLFVSLAHAVEADRHVFLDTDADGTLNQCPNPAHNTFNTPSLGNLQYCAGGTEAGKMIGDKTGKNYVADVVGVCGVGGTTTNVTNEIAADIDADGASEIIYGHPQACVWDMVTSDSCEVHAGTYIKSGAYADSNSQDVGTGPIAGSDLCERNTCWFASVVAPGALGGAYGTAGSPGYLRGAVMNSSTDDWDPNDDKDPADSAYPAIFSGDRDNDAVFDPTTGIDADNNGTFTGLGGSFRGDAFVAVLLGCMAPGAANYNWCGTGHNDNPWIDTDADGDFDTRANLASDGENRDPAHFIIKDLEFTRYNGGNTSGHTDSVHPYNGNIILAGDRSSNGIIVDHIYVHDNDYSLTAANDPGTETGWAILDDSVNGGCATFTEIKNSFLVQNNEKTIDDDCGLDNECGCPKNMHNNRIVLDVTSPRAANRRPVVAYFKSIDTFKGGTKKVVRFWNNEIININAGGGHFMDLQAFGNSMGTGLGELWVYGNIVRHGAGAGTNPGRWHFYYCGIGTGNYRYHVFNNTFDFDRNDGGTRDMEAVCGDSGELVVERNNAYYKATVVHASSATTTNRSNNVCSQSSQPDCPRTPLLRDGWWTVGTFGVATHAGLANYVAKDGGPLRSQGTCDPDGLGNCSVTTTTICRVDGDCPGGETCTSYAGVDYDWDGVNDTSWTDISGKTVTCETMGNAIDIGAIQFEGSNCGNDIREGNEVCDGTDLPLTLCVQLGFAPNVPGTITCLPNCSYYDTTGCEPYTRSRMSLLRKYFKGLGRLLGG